MWGFLRRSLCDRIDFNGFCQPKRGVSYSTMLTFRPRDSNRIRAVCLWLTACATNVTARRPETTLARKARRWITKHNETPSKSDSVWSTVNLQRFSPLFVVHPPVSTSRHQVPSGYSQNAQGAALNAAASLCRYVDGDIVAEVPLICERSLALMRLGCQYRWFMSCYVAVCFIGWFFSPRWSLRGS